MDYLDNVQRRSITMHSILDTPYVLTLPELSIGHVNQITDDCVYAAKENVNNLIIMQSINGADLNTAINNTIEGKTFAELLAIAHSFRLRTQIYESIKKLVRTEVTNQFTCPIFRLRCRLRADAICKLNQPLQPIQSSCSTMNPLVELAQLTQPIQSQTIQPIQSQPTMQANSIQPIQPIQSQPIMTANSIQSIQSIQPKQLKSSIKKIGQSDRKIPDVLESNRAPGKTSMYNRLSSGSDTHDVQKRVRFVEKQTKSAVEPKQTDTKRPAVEPKQTDTKRPAVEPKQTKSADNSQTSKNTDDYQRNGKKKIKTSAGWLFFKSNPLIPKSEDSFLHGESSNGYPFHWIVTQHDDMRYFKPYNHSLYHRPVVDDGRVIKWYHYDKICINNITTMKKITNLDYVKWFYTIRTKQLPNSPDPQYE